LFEGEWLNGKREGRGKLINKSGEMKEGVWKNDKRWHWAGEDPQGP
jgi:hypothetical protein